VLESNIMKQGDITAWAIAIVGALSLISWGMVMAIGFGLIRL
jgi:hypothetical protein